MAGAGAWAIAFARRWRFAAKGLVDTTRFAAGQGAVAAARTERMLAMVGRRRSASMSLGVREKGDVVWIMTVVPAARGG